jgi:hypothetical protein
VPCFHYRGSSLTLASDLWVSEDGNYPVSGVFASPSGAAIPFSYSFDITHINNPGNVVTSP